MFLDCVSFVKGIQLSSAKQLYTRLNTSCVPTGTGFLLINLTEIQHFLKHGEFRIIPRTEPFADLANYRCTF
jgi:hypothetical protein